MRYRAIYWILFPVLLVLFLFKGFVFDSYIFNTSVNLIFLFAQFVILTAYFSFKNRRWVDITRKYIGLGDMLFLMTLGFYLSPLNFLAFYIISLTVVLVITILLLRKGSQFSMQIPLAGLQAFFFALLLIVDWSTNYLNLQSDDWLIHYMI
jgi:hypothetical protein